MLCIAAFIVFLILGIFSARYRSLAGKAWYCVKRRVTFKPCDINFADEVKNRLLSKVILKKPRLARFLDKWIDWFAFAFVALSIWSLWSVSAAGLNLWVYDTCDPTNAESCSLSGEACGVSNELSFNDALAQNRLGEWIIQPFTTFGETIARIPDRLKNWDAREFLTENNTYYYPYDDKKPTSLEVFDPGCQYCKKMLTNMKNVQFESRYNLTYIAYPIPDSRNPNGYKFANSYLMTQYLEAVKQVPLSANPKTIAPDWQLLEKIFMENDEKNVPWQNNFNLVFGTEDAEMALKKLLGEIGYTPEQMEQISTIAHSDATKQIIAKNRDVVENKIRTIKIPTIMFNSRRYDRVVDENTLR